jgi:hypothetical protein
MDPRIRELTEQFASACGLAASSGYIQGGTLETLFELMDYIEARMEWPPPRPPFQPPRGPFLL